MSKIYEFDARMMHTSDVQFTRFPVYFGLIFGYHNIPITLAQPVKPYNSDHRIGMITRLTEEHGKIDNYPLSTFRLELNNSTPMGKFAEYLLDDLISDSDRCKTGELGVAKNIMVRDNMQDHNCALYLQFYGAVYSTILEDYYEIIYTNTYTERDKKVHVCSEECN